ncbi:MAG: uracil-DNA glycosylase [Proteobacteria bacterium]|nr:uracil-DNA glycosylase [Pseudomonadota bacterium]
MADLYKEMGSNQLYTEQPQDHRQTAMAHAPIAKASKQAAFRQANDHGKTVYEGEARNLADACGSLEELRKAVMAFDGCEIKKMAVNTVFADGNPKAEVMLVGEAPGANEDQQGIPFCGQSGKLLDNILASIGLSRQNAYITNTIFWRPPGNRRPTPEELRICRPFVEKHIALVGPKLIILVGSTAVEALLENTMSMHEMRGQYYTYHNRYLKQPIQTAVIFHPSYLLRQQSKKKEMWLDVQKIKYELLNNK